MSSIPCLAKIEDIWQDYESFFFEKWDAFCFLLFPLQLKLELILYYLGFYSLFISISWCFIRKELQSQISRHYFFTSPTP